MTETNTGSSGSTATTPTYLAASIINQAVEAVIGLMNALGLYATVTRGALPTADGITCEIGPSTPSEVYLDKNKLIPLDLTVNGKHSNLKTLSDAMNAIHEGLTFARSYPEGEEWQIVDIRTATEPQKLGREENNDWLMASSLTVLIETKKESATE